MHKKLFGLCIILFMLVGTAAPARAASLTGAQVQAIIGLLQSFGADSATIAHVQTALNGTSSGGSTQAWCHTFSTNLKNGDSDPTAGAPGEVGALRFALGREGFNPHDEHSTNFPDHYGDGFATAVKAFQSKYGITKTGIVGPKTRAKLNALYRCIIPVATPKITISNLQINPSNPKVNEAAILSFDINKNIGKHINNEWDIVIRWPQGVRSTNQTSSCVAVGVGERCSAKYGIIFAQTGQQGVNVYVAPVRASQDSSNATSSSLMVVVESDASFSVVPPIALQDDAVIRSDLATIQTQAEIYYGGTGANSYGTTGNSCSAAVFSDATIAKAIAGAQAANGGTTLTCNNSTTAYAISSKLYPDTTSYWCVDSIGNHSKSTTPLGTNTVCPAKN